MKATRRLIRQLRASGSESTEVEVKSGLHGFPRSALETMSAFANGSGGTILFGLSDRSFRPVKGFDAQRVHDAVSNAVRSKLTPHPSVELSIEQFEGARIVRADVEELPYFEKPCFIASVGAYGGSYVRLGEGDHRLSEYEVSQLRDNRTQPAYDREPVEGCGQDVLSAPSVVGLLEKAAARTPAAFAGVEPRVALKRLNVTADSSRRSPVTLAGLLALGVYPQEFFPQLNVTFVAIPGTTLGQVCAQSEVFTENQSFNGPMPALVAAAVAAVRRSTLREATEAGSRGEGTAAGSRGSARHIPERAVREAVTNALMHRDYSPYARGMQVQMELYADRLEISSPGGLYGGVRAEELGRVFRSSSRNAALAKLLEEVEMPHSGGSVCENRGSGLVRMAYAMRRADLPAPEFRTTPTSVTVVLRREPASAALGTVRDGGEAVDVGTALDGGGALDVGGALDGGRLAWASAAERERELLRFMIARGRPVTSREVQRRLALSQSGANRVLRRLIEAGAIRATAPPRSRHRAYAATGGTAGEAGRGGVLSERSQP